MNMFHDKGGLSDRMLVADVLYGIAGALATLAVVTYAVAAVSSRTTKPLAQTTGSSEPC
ncbi:hypothetical protein AB0392_32320 [Nonomuraea angiospora]|uniref:hypothetical protein n=1 Tax=Nonomuraea angiospora TaxID=46172 RepID=UPI0034504990